MSLFACAQPPISYYKNKTPAFDIRKYFNGNLSGWGILKDWKGEVTRSFTVDINGSWKGNKGTLKEYFVFDDGEKSTRTWHVTVIDNHNFTAYAEDTVGKAKGEQYGNAMRMDYVLSIPVGEKTIDIRIDDWMHLVDKKKLINVSKLKKFGINVGSLSIGFIKK